MATQVTAATPGTTILSGTLTGIESFQTHTFVARGGDVVSIIVTSDTFDPFLVLRDPENTVVRENDDCGSIRHSCIREQTLTLDGVYLVVVDSYDAHSVGDYDLEITITRTVTPTPISTILKTDTPTPTSGVCAGLTSPFSTVPSNSASINLRDGPGTNFSAIGVAHPGDCLEIIGRNQNNTWLLIQFPSGRTGWLSAGLVEVTGNLDSIPLVNP
jgi:hypothetical protein